MGNLGRGCKSGSYPGTVSYSSSSSSVSSPSSVSQTSVLISEADIGQFLRSMHDKRTDLFSFGMMDTTE